jgi:hypothetical protein
MTVVRTVAGAVVMTAAGAVVRTVVTKIVRVVVMKLQMTLAIVQVAVRLLIAMGILAM